MRAAATSETISPPSSADDLRILTLAGPPALTSFEADRLTARLRAIDPAVTAVDAAFFYVLLVSADLSRDFDRANSPESARGLDIARLTELLELTSTGLPEPRLFIAPRIGTQSPWSSKATDILHNTGFDKRRSASSAPAPSTSAAHKTRSPSRPRSTTA